jgi:hypothetical protein
MHKHLRVAALGIAVVLAAPTMGFAQPGASSSSASGFNWFANTPSPAMAQQRAVTRASLVINSSRTWICSPAGFGKRSTCVSG